MIVSAWKIHRFVLRKMLIIEDPIENSDALCLTETWYVLNEQTDWVVISCVTKEVRDKRPSCGEVSLLIQKHLRLRVRERFESKHIQAIAVSVMSTPIVGCYVSPKQPPRSFASS